jgi:AAA domain
LYDLIIGSRSKSNGPWTGGSYEWSEEWLQKKLDAFCEEVRTATTHHRNDACRKVHIFGEWVGAYDKEKAWNDFKNAVNKNVGRPDNYEAEAKRAFDSGVADPKEPPNEARIEALPKSQWFGEQAAPIPPALVKGILPQTGVATIGGQSGTGKSFQAIHLGIRLIPECNQHTYIDRYRIKRHGGVLYLVLEGKPAFPMRVTAAFEAFLKRQPEFGEKFRLPFAWNSYTPFLLDKGPDNLLRLADREQKRMRQDFSVDLVAIFLDTMGLAACFENENMAAQVQRVVAGLLRLSDETGGSLYQRGSHGQGHRSRNARYECEARLCGDYPCLFL